MADRVLWSRRAATLAGAAAVAVAANLTAGAIPASATPLAIDSAGCVAEGASVFECFVRFSGGTAPYSTQWGGAPFVSRGTTAASGLCTPGVHYSVTIVVTDSAGGQASRGAGFTCRGGPPR